MSKRNPLADYMCHPVMKSKDGIRAVYLTADVDELRRRYFEQKARVAALCHENAELHRQLDRYRRRESCDYLNLD